MNVLYLTKICNTEYREEFSKTVQAQRQQNDLVFTYIILKCKL